jgi:hypothetical protein
MILYDGELCSMMGSSRGRDEEKVNNAADYDSPSLGLHPELHIYDLDHI